MYGLEAVWLAKKQVDSIVGLYPYKAVPDGSVSNIRS